MDAIDPGRSSHGTAPRNALYAVFDTHEDTVRAQDALAAGGIKAECREAASTRGVGAWLERMVMRFGDEAIGRHHYNAHLSQGCTVLVIPVPDHASARRIADVLLQYGAYDVAYFSRWTVTPLNADAYDVAAQPTPLRR